MGQSSLPRINEVANFLSKYATPAQRSLSERGGEIAELVEPGTFGGTEEIDESRMREGLTARATVISEALREAIILSEGDISEVKRRLRLMKRVRYVGLILGAVSASAVIGSAFSGKTATLIAGVIALGSNLLALTADQLILGPKTGEDSLRAASSTMVRVIGEGHLMQQLLTTFLKINFESSEIRQVIEEANGLFAELNKARASILSNS
jgi:hypothetical protein